MLRPSGWPMFEPPSLGPPQWIKWLINQWIHSLIIEFMNYWIDLLVHQSIHSFVPLKLRPATSSTWCSAASTTGAAPDRPTTIFVQVKTYAHTSKYLDSGDAFELGAHPDRLRTPRDSLTSAGTHPLLAPAGPRTRLRSSFIGVTRHSDPSMQLLLPSKGQIYPGVNIPNSSDSPP